MATLKWVERQIQRVEGFRVEFSWRYGNKNARSDAQGITAFPYKLMAKNRMTVSGWKRTRFAPHYPGFVVDVLDASGNKCNGNMHLATVRDTYLE